ncbi:MAG: hypothetical protein ABI667_05615 [Sphingomicrobium sp.]
MRILLGAIMIMGLAAPAFPQQPPPPQQQSQKQNLSDDDSIVVTGIANGSRVVEVDFDKVWKNCAECKRALARLDRLARNFRDERNTAAIFANPGGNCRNARPSTAVTFQRSSAEPVGERARTANSITDGLCAARAEDRSRRTYESVAQKYVVPEQAKLMTHMRSFLDQLAPHLREATEAERIAHGASAGLTDTKRTRLSAKNVKRIDVTQAVIRRLDAKQFTIALPDPEAPGPARGGYDPIR